MSTKTTKIVKIVFNGKKYTREEWDAEDMDTDYSCTFCGGYAGTVTFDSPQIPDIPLCENCEPKLMNRELIDYLPRNNEKIIDMDRGFRAYPVPQNRPKPLDLLKLHIDLEQMLREYLVLPNEDLYGLIASWIMGTYHLRPHERMESDRIGFTTFPMLLFKGSPGCGKTLATKISTLMSYRGTTKEFMSVPFAVRKAHATQDTLGIDQLESQVGVPSKRSIDQNKFRGFILSCYTYGMGYSVAKGGDDPMATITYDTFGARAMNTIKEPDPEISRRCIHIAMYEDDSPPKRTWDEDFADGKLDELRGRLLESRYDKRFKLEYPLTSKSSLSKKVYKSKYEMIVPFLTIASFIGQMKPYQKYDSAIRYMETINSDYMEEARGDTLEYEVFHVLAQMVVDGYNPNSQEIINNSPWLHSNKISPAVVGRLLRKEGVPMNANKRRKWDDKYTDVLMNRILPYYNIPKPQSTAQVAAQNINKALKKSENPLEGF